MQRYEYKAVPAPRRGEKARGVKRTEDRFALTLTTLMNDLAQDGWEYRRADTLPCEERTGLTGRITTGFQTVLVFRRALPGAEPKADAAPLPQAEPFPPLPSLAPRYAAPPDTPESRPAAPAATRTPFGASPRLAPVPTVPPATGAAPALGPAAGPAPGGPPAKNGDRAAE